MFGASNTLFKKNKTMSKKNPKLWVNKKLFVKAKQNYKRMRRYFVLTYKTYTNFGMHKYQNQRALYSYTKDRATCI